MDDLVPVLVQPIRRLDQQAEREVVARFIAAHGT
jgi:hypothetical protein